uniref:Late embryogenesis abundant protein LEA-2 subgroup domain-containing protein n=1 Tax=Oryza meridionalis TaxID=40149 RepID=A0A0E0C686_9ORYZ
MVDGCRKEPTAWENLRIAALLCLGIFGPLMVLAGVLYAIHGEDPDFSVQITGVDGLDPLRSSVVSPAFNLTFEVDNRREITRRYCVDKSTATVLYKNIDIAWGEVPALCFERWSRSKFNASLSAREGVLLSRQLLDLMAADLHVRELELDLEIQPIRPEEASRPCFISCALKLSNGEVGTPHPCNAHFCFYS